VEARLTALPRTRVAATLLALLIPREDVEAIIGDLEEEAAVRASGSRWYWVQVARSIPAVLWLPIVRGGWLATCGVALTACATQTAIEVTTGFAIHRFAPADALWPSIAALAVTLTSLALVSFKASRVRRGAATVLAGIAVGAVTLQLALVAQAGGELPAGTLAALIVAPGTVLAGGFLSSSSRSRRLPRGDARR
jgi:hypothetical protein